ncbi:MAG: hypothetical protein DLM72_08450 [Candidatus Nitrosopolaris wilkensis]|nr:MAG: hypothetical protein DLM72_08450 [Candidatus Nitrosopolaris wilkensis]
MAKSFQGCTFQKAVVLTSKPQLQMRKHHTPVREDTKMNMSWEIIWTGLDSEQSDLHILVQRSWREIFIGKKETDYRPQAHLKPQMLSAILAKYGYLPTEINMP